MDRSTAEFPYSYLLTYRVGYGQLIRRVVGVSRPLDADGLEYLEDYLGATHGDGPVRIYGAGLVGVKANPPRPYPVFGNALLTIALATSFFNLVFGFSLLFGNSIRLSAIGAASVSLFPLTGMAIAIKSDKDERDAEIRLWEQLQEVMTANSDGEAIALPEIDE
jgi:hypothetical protein